MAPRKAKAQQILNQVQGQPSHQQPVQIQQYPGLNSYEVDPNLQAQLIPPAPRSEAELNLSVLQRYNAEVQSIEHIAPYGVVYEWSGELNSWDKSGIEGSVFVCKLWGNAESDERFAIIVLNRRQLNNLDYELRSEAEVEFTDQYIILMDPSEGDSHKIYGLWIFAEAPPSSTATQPQEVADKVRDCVARAEAGRKAKVIEAQQAQASASQLAGRKLTVQDLFGAPTKPQNDGWTGNMGFDQPGAQEVDFPSASVTPSLFSHSADTSFFLTSQTATPPVPQQLPFHPHPLQGQATDAQRDHLVNLFRQAGGQSPGNLHR